MNVLPITKEGTWFEVAQLPFPWPPAKEITLGRRTASDGEFLVAATPNGSLRAAITRAGDSSPSLEATSCPIIATVPGAPIRVIVTWSETSSELNIFIDGTMVGSLKSPDTIPASYSTTATTNTISASNNHEDFSRLSRGAQADRKNRWNNFKPHKDRVDGGKEYIVAEFRNSIAILGEHQRLVREGKLQFIRELAGDLRTLLQASRPMPLLQQRAAADDKPLTVYTSARPSLQIPITVAFRLELNAKASPGGLWHNPIDIDVWLSHDAFTSSTTTLSHGELIQELGNTIGSHLDRDMLPSVINLKASRTTHGFDVEVDMIQSYLSGLADMTIELSQPLL